MNRRSFMSALGAALGFFGLSKLVQAEEKPVYKYVKFFRNCDQATMDEFKDIIHLVDTGKSCNTYKVPVIWGTEDKAAAYMMESNIQRGVVVDKIKLPLINIYRGDMFFNDKIHAYYHVTATTLYEEDMNQILEQIVVKFHPKLKNKVGEYSLMSMINNYYPGGSVASVQAGLTDPQAMRGEMFSAAKWGKQGECPVKVLKHQFNLILAIEGKP